jgi:hypothetical protein
MARACIPWLNARLICAAEARLYQARDGPGTIYLLFHRLAMTSGGILILEYVSMRIAFPLVCNDVGTFLRSSLREADALSAGIVHSLLRALDSNAHVDHRWGFTWPLRLSLGIGAPHS